jgi:NAD(P)-dependent dehydrogenase (short-subunit alcohol dehydrogenase family)
MIETGLHNKVALTTGASNPRGIGAAAARAIAAQGAAVFLTYLRVGQPVLAGSDTDTRGAARYVALNALPAERVVDALRAAGGRVEAGGGRRRRRRRTLAGGVLAERLGVGAAALVGIAGGLLSFA